LAKRGIGSEIGDEVGVEVANLGHARLSGRKLDFSHKSVSEGALTELALPKLRRDPSAGREWRIDRCAASSERISRAAGMQPDLIYELLRCAVVDHPHRHDMTVRLQLRFEGSFAARWNERHDAVL
jgi:hypothetical protein